MQDPLFTNSTTPDYGYLEPSVGKRLPFPLENTEESLIIAANALDSVKRKLQHCKSYNGINSDVARSKHTDKMLYKINTIMNLIQALSIDLDEMYL